MLFFILFINLSSTYQPTLHCSSPGAASMKIMNVRVRAQNRHFYFVYTWHRGFVMNVPVSLLGNEITQWTLTRMEKKKRICLFALSHGFDCNLYKHLFSRFSEEISHTVLTSSLVWHIIVSNEALWGHLALFDFGKVCESNIRQLLFLFWGQQDILKGEF